MSRWAKLLKYKVRLSTAETGREYLDWYNKHWTGSWKSLDRNPKGSMYRRRRRSRRRLTKQVVVVSPPRKRRRVGGRSGATYARSSKKERFSRTQIGQRVGTSLPKENLVNAQIAFALNTRTLNAVDISDIEKTTTNDINDRQRNIVNLRGYKIYMNFINTIDTTLTLNVAILSPRNKTDVPTSGFFRDGTTNTRELDFANARDNLVFSKYPINPDKYIILKHKRYELVAHVAGGTTTNLTGKNYRTMKWWIPIKRQLRFENSGGDSSFNKIFFVCWCDKTNALSGAMPEAAITHNHYVHAVYKEPGQI